MKYALLLSVLALVACSGNTTPQAESQPTPPPVEASEEAKMITVTGTIVFKNLEGGFIGFDANNGKKYMPRGLAKEHRKPGLVLEITGEVLDVLTFQQYGEVLKVKDVKVIDDSKVGQQSNHY
ncbi:hypothetical protein LJ739_07205 [Aestuariibacter halophilus]|uniref:Bacterial OB-fold domain-containing protein n=1 Tax=Fluctibacter halophilus TaxID=226011 RepID=A0ABS8G6A5_9ALTE|nr:hypothetical protein [Aestuariibacter halophilus]MCC2616024.1 hypothetical protein [Aestuariibacter halophilus]